MMALWQERHLIRAQLSANTRVLLILTAVTILLLHLLMYPRPTTRSPFGSVLTLMADCTEWESLAAVLTDLFQSPVVGFGLVSGTGLHQNG